MHTYKTYRYIGTSPYLYGLYALGYSISRVPTTGSTCPRQPNITERHKLTMRPKNRFQGVV